MNQFYWMFVKISNKRIENLWTKRWVDSFPTLLPFHCLNNHFNITCEQKNYLRLALSNPSPSRGFPYSINLPLSQHLLKIISKSRGRDVIIISFGPNQILKIGGCDSTIFSIVFETSKYFVINLRNYKKHQTVKSTNEKMSASNKRKSKRSWDFWCVVIEPSAIPMISDNDKTQHWCNKCKNYSQIKTVFFIVHLWVNLQKLLGI